MFKKIMWMLILIIVLAHTKLFAQSAVVVMNPIKLMPHTTVYVVFDGTQPVMISNFDYLIASQFGLSRATQTDITNSRLNDIYTRQSDSSTHKITTYQGDNPWIIIGTATISNMQEIIDALNGVSRSTQTDITNGSLADIYARLLNLSITSGIITVDNLYKDVIISSGHIIIDNQNYNVVVDSGHIIVDNQYKNVVVDSGNITVDGSITVNNPISNVWVTSGNIIVDNLYKDVIVSSGHIIVDNQNYNIVIDSGHILIDNQYKNVVIDSGSITYTNEETRFNELSTVTVVNQYKNIVIDSGSITVDGSVTVNNPVNNVWITSGNITIDSPVSVKESTGIIINNDYFGKVSSGTFGYVCPGTTDATTFTLDINQAITAFSIVCRDLPNIEHIGEATTNFTGGTIPLIHGMTMNPVYPTRLPNKATYSIYGAGLSKTATYFYMITTLENK